MILERDGNTFNLNLVSESVRPYSEGRSGGGGGGGAAADDEDVPDMAGLSVDDAKPSSSSGAAAAAAAVDDDDDIPDMDDYEDGVLEVKRWCQISVTPAFRKAPCFRPLNL